MADTGPGIPYDMQDVIFEKFRQIDASHTREHAGTGLGLAICRELAQMLGATVSFVTEPGRGATFFVDLPLTHQPQAPQPLMSNACELECAYREELSRSGMRQASASPAEILSASGSAPACDASNFSGQSPSGLCMSRRA